jgi:hypothetical protein
MQVNHWTNALVVAFCIAAFGCGPKEADRGAPAALDAAKPDATAPTAPKAAAKPHDHDHAAPGPHGGHLIELGNHEYVAELAHDDGKRIVTVYLLDSAGKEPVAADDATLSLQLLKAGEFVDFALTATDAQPAQSAFSLGGDDLHEAMEQENVRGRLHVTIAGKKYTGAIELDEHDHDH